MGIWRYSEFTVYDVNVQFCEWRHHDISGDVIISVNGQSTEGAEHAAIVDLIRSAPADKMRMVVLFQNCVKKVQLHQRLLKLKTLLENKEVQLKALKEQEAKLVEG